MKMAVLGRAAAGVAFACAALACSSRAPDNRTNSATAGAGTGAGASAGEAGSTNSVGGTASVAGAGSSATGGAGGSAGSEALGGAGSSGMAGAGSSLPGCELSFPYQDEPTLGTWLGGDSAYSLPLSPTVALWSFQDTFVGMHGQTARPGAGLIANSYAHFSCEHGVGSIRYFWKQGGAILSDGAEGQRFWPQQPIIYKGYLFQAMTRVQNAADEIGTTLARVENPLDPPDAWHAEYFELAKLSGLGKGTIVVDGYAYLFGNAGEAVVARLPLDELIKPDAVPSALLEYLASDGQWKPGLDTQDAKKLGFSANVGTSFRYLQDAGKWLVLFTSTSGWPNPNIAVSTAPDLSGPWSKPVNVYQVPEMTAGSPEYDKDNVCYAAVEHHESNPEPETDLLFSYTCNSFVFAKQQANMGIYLPKIVRLKIPAL
jgi:hypothetical protein